MKTAKLGSISHGTLRTEDLLHTFACELESLVLLNGDYYSKPENFGERDWLNKLISESQDAWKDDGETLKDENLASDLVCDLQDNLQNFSPSYCYFGTHPGDGADFGFWPSDLTDLRDQIEFASSKENEYPPDDYTGEWLHINERGNCTLYSRQSGKDTEIWSVV